MRFIMVNFVYLFYTIVKGFYLSKLLSVSSMSCLCKQKAQISTRFNFQDSVNLHTVIFHEHISKLSLIRASAS